MTAAQRPLAQMPEACPHEDKLADLVTIATTMDSRVERIENALIGTIEQPGGVLVRLHNLERQHRKVDERLSIAEDKVENHDPAVREWRKVKRWAIGAAISAVLGSGLIARFMPPAVSDTVQTDK